VKGSGNGGGLKLEKGAQATVDDDTDIDHETTTIYVRTGGDDDNLGTLASPYATFVRAMEDVPLVHEEGKQYVVDITGITEELIDYRMPAFQSSSRDLVFDLTNNDVAGIKGAVTIYAEPATEATITAGEISAQNADANTGMITFVTTNSYTPDQFKGMFIQGSDPWEWGVISGNTATDIETTASSTFTAPITIRSPGATLQNTTDYKNVLHQSTGVTAYTGVHFKQTGHVNGRAFKSAWDDSLTVMVACQCDGMEHRDGTIAHRFSYFTKQMWAAGPWFRPFSCVFDTVEWAQRSSGFPKGTVGFSYCYFLGCNGTGVLQDSNALTPGLELEIDSCEIRDSTGYGIFIAAGALIAEDTNIKDSASHAIKVTGQAAVVLTSVKGSGNTGGGLLVEDGAQVVVNSDTDVNTGEAPEVTVGANAAVTWATFRSSGPPYNEVDATVQLARLVQRT
jgi:hypothetical protein